MSDRTGVIYIGFRFPDTGLSSEEFLSVAQEVDYSVSHELIQETEIVEVNGDQVVVKALLESDLDDEDVQNVLETLYYSFGELERLSKNSFLSGLEARL